jgi:hypothetical protein
MMDEHDTDEWAKRRENMQPNRRNAMTTLSDFYTARNKGNRYGARQLAESELGFSRHEWDLRKEKSIRELGLMYAWALSALLNEKPPLTKHGGTKIEQLAFAAGLPAYWGAQQ